MKKYTPKRVDAYFQTNKSSFEAYQNNLDLLMERFPKIALFAHTFQSDYQFFYTDRKELNAKKDKQCIHHEGSIESEINQWRQTLDLEDKEAIYIYGIGLGYPYLALYSWLKESEKKDLIFLEDDPEVFSTFLHTALAEQIIQDPQVTFYFFHESEKKQETIKQITHYFPVEKVEVFALPLYMKIKLKKYQYLRLTILRRSLLSHAVFNDRMNSQVPFRNFLENIFRLNESFYANILKGVFQNIPAIICGAGPSLDKSLDLLKQVENRGLIFAGGSTLAALSSHGILPHMGVIVDPNEEEFDRLKKSFAFEIPMFYSTRVHPLVFSTFNAFLGYMRAGIGGIPELWIEEELRLDGELISKGLDDESLSVTTICIALADFLGCSPIILNGCDLAYSQKKRYAQGVLEDKENRIPKQKLLKRKGVSGKYVDTSVQWIMESYAISEFAKRYSKSTFFNASEEGLGFSGIENVSFQTLFDQALTKEYDLRSWLYAEIQNQYVPLSSDEHLKKLIKKLALSTERCQKLVKTMIEEIERIQDGSYQSGKMVLAEMDLKEEDAYCYLFYDLFQNLEKLFQRTYKHSYQSNHWEGKKMKWEWFGRKIGQYLSVMKDRTDLTCFEGFST